MPSKIKKLWSQKKNNEWIVHHQALMCTININLIHFLMDRFWFLWLHYGINSCFRRLLHETILARIVVVHVKPYGTKRSYRAWRQAVKLLKHRVLYYTIEVWYGSQVSISVARWKSLKSSVLYLKIPKFSYRLIYFIKSPQIYSKNHQTSNRIRCQKIIRFFLLFENV